MIKASCSYAVALLCVLWAGHANAHARLVKSDPPAESVLTVAPTAITLWFNEAPEKAFSSIQVLDDQQRVIVNGELNRTAEATGLQIIVPLLATGAYEVRYRVLSVDGHLIDGAFSFRVSASPDE